jgi:hypothetical protein
VDRAFHVELGLGRTFHGLPWGARAGLSWWGERPLIAGGHGEWTVPSLESWGSVIAPSMESRGWVGMVRRGRVDCGSEESGSAWWDSGPRLPWRAGARSSGCPRRSGPRSTLTGRKTWTTTRGWRTSRRRSSPPTTPRPPPASTSCRSRGCRSGPWRSSLKRAQALARAPHHQALLVVVAPSTAFHGEPRQGSARWGRRE